MLAFIQAWNEITEDVFPKCFVLNPPRRRTISHALQEGTLKQWRLAFHALVRSDFHKGANGRKWKANIDFILRPSHRATWLEAGQEVAEELERERRHRAASRREEYERIQALQKRDEDARAAMEPKACEGCRREVIHTSAPEDTGLWLCWPCWMKRRAPPDP